MEKTMLCFICEWDERLSDSRTDSVNDNQLLVSFVSEGSVDLLLVVGHGENCASFDVDIMVVEERIVSSKSGGPEVDESFLSEREKQFYNLFRAQNLKKKN